MQALSQQMLYADSVCIVHAELITTAKAECTERHVKTGQAAGWVAENTWCAYSTYEKRCHSKEAQKT